MSTKESLPATVLRSCLIGNAHCVRGDFVELPKDRHKRLIEQQVVVAEHVRLDGSHGKIETATLEPATAQRKKATTRKAAKKAAARK